jgi:hypothetical protein
MKLNQRHFRGGAAAPAAVRRALAPDTNVVERAIAQITPPDADDVGVIGCARGGRAPQFKSRE